MVMQEPISGCSIHVRGKGDFINTGNVADDMVKNYIATHHDAEEDVLLVDVE